MTEKYQIGIDLGGTNIAAGIVDENFRIVGKASVPTEVNGKNGVASPEEIADRMAQAVRLAAERRRSPWMRWARWALEPPVLRTLFRES